MTDIEEKEILSPKRLKWNSLTPEEQSYLSWFPKYIESLEHCIKLNGDFTRNLALTVANDWGASSDPSTWSKSNYNDYDKVKSILKQMIREWSDEGEDERNVSMNRILKYLETKYPRVIERQHIKILIPGSGLGRLNFELVKRGFWCQGNEFSYHMLLASNFLLNHSYTKNHYSIYPMIHNFSNQQNKLFQTRPIYLPDLHNKTELLELQTKYPEIQVGELMSIASGSFTDLYGPNDLSISEHYSQDPQASEFRKSNENQFDIVITQFFLDTSSNIIEYLKTLNHTLKPNGTWINFGPLLWHFEEIDDVYEIKHADGTIKPSPVKGLELSRDDLIELCKNWFDFNHHETGIESGYSSDPKALGGWKYKCEYWIATNK
ncbi:hypothetical protein BN7_4036 [Wickerhamomyces ciferrii]|uniref:carnosine N-methyltransferase n=1 Tax=Wickerhamomyces ciferrii (strain ATCC 14091 / BCRC 22168 / CBS 111 / JCM 3599 / NBRC 0793 / NRRL Y-1031 F-60-10) TaxID=1206466 RepID=K0KQQ8_WICCF|nr:uncharacterized protein BN7_4036 [Wickerhamomyces ciferrii]CCH44472.1 hypothetical protein BN7_4036 [Wickerhamomyces ciferrii]